MAETKEHRGAGKKTLGIELPGLVKVLANSLYSNREVALRELIQNANDASVRRQVHQQDLGKPLLERDLGIRIFFRSNRLVISDQGMGLDRQEIEDYLATIGRSGTRKFREALEAGGREAASRLIGSFGLGLLAAFVIADKVEVETRSANPDGPAYRWTCDGNGRYDLTEIDRREVGTETRLRISPSQQDLLREDRLREIVKRYADFISFPILVGARSAEQVNVINAPWHRQGLEELKPDDLQTEFGAYLKERYGDQWDEPLAVFPLYIQRAGIEVKGALYVPRTPEEDRPGGTVDLYVRRMFIRSHLEGLLPSWASFFYGIVDSPTLNELVSREEIRRDDSFKKVRQALENEIIDQIERMAVRQGRTLFNLFRIYDHQVKLGTLQSDKFFRAVCDLIRFVSVPAGSTNLPDYLARAQVRDSDEGVIYYFSQPESRAQYLRLFQEKDVEVIDASGRYDAPFLEHYAHSKEIQASRLDVGADHLFEQLSNLEEHEKWRILEECLKRIGHDIEVQTVRFEPPEIPAVLTSPDKSEPAAEWESALEKYGQTLPEEVRITFQKLIKDARKGRVAGILNLNANNKLLNEILTILNSEADPDAPAIATEALHQIYHSARQFAQEEMTQEMLQHVYDLNNDILLKLCLQTKKFLEQKKEALGLKGQIRDLEEKVSLQNQLIEKQKSEIQDLTTMIGKPLE